MRKITNASKWSITTAIYTAKDHPENISKQLKENSEKFNWDGINFPASFKDIDTFEEKKIHRFLSMFLVMSKKSIH